MEALAEALMGDAGAVLRMDCAELGPSGQNRAGEAIRVTYSPKRKRMTFASSGDRLSRYAIGVLAKRMAAAAGADGTAA